MMILAAADGFDLLQVGIRILHMLSAFAAGGAVLFQGLALSPALVGEEKILRQRLGAAIAGRWRPIAYAAMLLLLATGLLNFMVYQIPAYQSHPSKGVYHGLFGLKLLAALQLFHGVTALVMPAPKGDKYRANASGWYAYLGSLVVIIVVVAAVMRYFPQLFPSSAENKTPMSQADSNAKGRAAVLRGALELYYYEHSTYPGATTDGVNPAGSETTFRNQLTMHSSSSGEVSSTRSAAHPFGPYLVSKWPDCPVAPRAGKSDVLMVSGATKPEYSASAATAGWVYNFDTGQICLNSNERDKEGVRYDEY